MAKSNSQTHQTKRRDIRVVCFYGILNYSFDISIFVYSLWEYITVIEEHTVENYFSYVLCPSIQIG